MDIQSFTNLTYEDYINAEFSFEIHDSLLNQATKAQQVNDLRYFLFIHNEKLSQVEKEVLNNKANMLLDKYIDSELKRAREFGNYINNRGLN
jgi:hypothetical protein